MKKVPETAKTNGFRLFLNLADGEAVNQSRSGFF